MRDPEIDIILRRNYSLAQALNLNGTPSFLIGDTLLKGGRDADTMLNIVRASRKKS
jgi:protein-disulfide isomerase